MYVAVSKLFDNAPHSLLTPLYAKTREAWPSERSAISTTCRFYFYKIYGFKLSPTHSPHANQKCAPAGCLSVKTPPSKCPPYLVLAACWNCEKYDSLACSCLAMTDWMFFSGVNRVHIVAGRRKQK